MSEPLTITAAAPLLRAGELTPSELLEQCLRRIDVYEPAVKAWAYMDRERARQDAAKATDEIKAGHYRGPLHGIPIGIKDIIDVFDMPTGCGSKLWANSYARQDATCVERLRQAGAVILGKTVTTAYAYLDPPVTRNPWNLDRTPGGSSSGSAAAVACGMCLAALGTQTGGSLIRPASYCGVCALKPTWGRVSVTGVLPLAPSLDHIGVMANCVRDLAVVLQAIAKTDPHDGSRRDSAPHPYHYSHAVDEGLSDYMAMLGSFPDLLPDRIQPELEAAFSELRARTASRGWSWKDLPLHPIFNDCWRHHLTIMASEAAVIHGERLARRPDEYPPGIRGLIEKGLRSSAVDLMAAERHRDLLHEQSVAMFPDGWQVAAVPATTGAAPDAATTGDFAPQGVWSYLGLPVVSLPFATDADGMPLAVQLVGWEWCEDSVLRTAAQLERDLSPPVRLPPVPTGV
jgi:aspartyl-tRNA(Asn)/glutamyl-tRNA(Gln) amidotransferase subunit A